MPEHPRAGLRRHRAAAMTARWTDMRCALPGPQCRPESPANLSAALSHACLFQFRSELRQATAPNESDGALRQPEFVGHLKIWSGRILEEQHFNQPAASRRQPLDGLANF